MSLVAGYAVRRVPTWGCGGELTARTEYTATAFSKPLMMIFRAVYRPTREVETVGEAHFPREVRYRAEIEPTFERFLYGPLTRGVLGAARADEGDPGRQPPRLPRLRHRPRPQPGAPAVVEGLTLLGIVLLRWLGGGR